MRVVWPVRPWMVALAAGLAALSLLAPWARSGAVDRSTIELLSSASALDVVDGLGEVIIVGSWFLIPVVASGAAISAGWNRVRLTSAFALPIGPMMALAAWAVAVSPLEVRWGAACGALLGMTTTSLAALLLMKPTSVAEGT